MTPTALQLIHILGRYVGGKIASDSEFNMLSKKVAERQFKFHVRNVDFVAATQLTLSRFLEPKINSTSSLKPTWKANTSRGICQNSLLSIYDDYLCLKSV